MRGKKSYQIVVSGKTHRELMRLKWQMMIRERRLVPMDELLREMLKKTEGAIRRECAGRTGFYFAS